MVTGEHTGSFSYLIQDDFRTVSCLIQHIAHLIHTTYYVAKVAVCAVQIYGCSLYDISILGL